MTVSASAPLGRCLRGAAALLPLFTGCFSPSASDSGTLAEESGSTGSLDASGSESTSAPPESSTSSTATSADASTSDGTESTGDPLDSSGSESTGPDPAGCDPSQPFAQIRLIEELATPDDEGSASLSPDELTLYFFSNTQSPGTADLDAYVATRPSLDDPFGMPDAVEAVNTGSDERGGWITADGLTFYFYSSRDPVTSYDIWVSTRATEASAFGDPEKLGPSINTEMFEQSAYVSPDGSTLYFQRESSLYRSVLGGNGFGDPTPVGELNGASALSPVLTDDGLTIYFSSDRPGGAGNLDIWRATRDSAGDPFSGIVNVSEINLDDFEFAEWASADDCRLYLTSRRPGGAGGWDMWVAERDR